MPKLLIVDDEEPLRTVFGMALEVVNYRCVLADGGDTALKMLASDSFDLVLLDLDMPVMGGLEVLQQMRGSGDATKVALISADLPRLAVLRGASLGVTTFVAKPVTLQVLRDAIASTLGEKVSEVGIESEVRRAAAHLDFQKASRLLASRSQRTSMEELWLKLFRHFAKGHRPEEIPHLAPGLERLVCH